MNGIGSTIVVLLSVLSRVPYVLQHANEDVEKMILGNKCDMEDKRQVSRERGDQVSCSPYVA